MPPNRRPDLADPAVGRLLRRTLGRWIEVAVPAAVTVAFVAALLVTATSEVPQPLPGIGMGSKSLFYIERGVAVFAALVIAMSLLARGLRGELPSQVSTTGLTYPETLERAVSSSDVAVTALSARVDKLDEDLNRRDEMLRLLANQVLDISAEIEPRKDAAGPSGGE
jgi:hypothetical protein